MTTTSWPDVAVLALLTVLVIAVLWIALRGQP